jgi:hypothetical protein
MDTATRQSLIARYIDGVKRVEAAVAGRSDEELDRQPPDGSWTARMVVHHLADSEMTSAIRLRRLICEKTRRSSPTTKSCSPAPSGTKPGPSPRRSSRCEPPA